MNEPKFKVGDKVRVLDGSKTEDYTGGWNICDMALEVGKEHVIKRITDYGKKTVYILDVDTFNECGKPFIWDERGLELVEPKATPKFKAGDIVKIVKIGFGIFDKKMIGKKFTVKSVKEKRGIGTVYKLSGPKDFSWLEWQLELVTDFPKIIITTDGKTTLARLYEEKKVVKSAEAHCSPDDTFDFFVGANLAMERLNKETPAVTPKDNKIPEILDGYMVEFSKGGAYWSAIVYHNDRGDLCFSSEDWAPVDEFDKNGINTLNRKIKITKIYGRTNSRCASHNTPEDRTLLWERK